MNFVAEPPNTDPTADHPHGIYTAGLLAANANNLFGVAGVDHKVMLLPVKVLDASNKGSTFDLVQGIQWAVDSGARVLSMSLINYPESDSL
jgi:subtilisin family serine protease